MIISIKPYDNQYFSVSFPQNFNQVMLNAIRNVPGRIWKGEEKLWLIPNKKDSQNVLLGNLYETKLFNVEEIEEDEVNPHEKKH